MVQVGQLKSARLTSPPRWKASAIIREWCHETCFPLDHYAITEVTAVDGWMDGGFSERVRYTYICNILKRFVSPPGIVPVILLSGSTLVW